MFIEVALPVIAARQDSICLVHLEHRLVVRLFSIGERGTGRPRKIGFLADQGVANV
jgi:hypothetical protein